MYARLILAPVLVIGLSNSLSAYQQPTYPVPTTTVQNTQVVNTPDATPVKKAKHVFTNDDFPHPEEKANASKAVEPAKPAPGDAAPPSNSDPKSADNAAGKNVDANAAQVDALKAKSADHQKSLDALQSQLGRLEHELTDPDMGKVKREKLENLRADMQQKIREYQDMKNQADQDLAAAQKNKDQKPADTPAPPPQS